MLETKRADDARHVRELETRLAEAESFVALRPKLQAKLNQLQTDLIATRRELSDAKQLAELSEGKIVEAQEQLEMATLDKEVAEERAEDAESQLEEAKERLAVVEVELQVLREGGGERAEFYSTSIGQRLILIGGKTAKVTAANQTRNLAWYTSSWRSRMSDSRRLWFGMRSLTHYRPLCTEVL